MQLQKGYTFSGKSPNNTVTAEKLNALVDAATILPGFYASQPEAGTVAELDYALILQGATGEYRKVQMANFAPANQGLSGFRNLHALAGTGHQVYVSASEILMRAANGRLHLALDFEAIADLGSYTGASTANGRDASSLPLTNTPWWYFWAISDGVQDKLLYSASATNPTLPAGYLYRALLGAARLDAAGNFVRFVQRNCDVALHLPSAAGTASAGLNPYTGSPLVEFTNVAPAAARTLQMVDLSRCIPPQLTAKVRGIIGSTDVGVNYHYALAPAGYTSLAAITAEVLEGLQLLPTVGLAAGAGMLGFNNAASFEHLVRDSQQLAWACDSTAQAKHSLRITGYTLSL